MTAPVRAGEARANLRVQPPAPRGAECEPWRVLSAALPPGPCSALAVLLSSGRLREMLDGECSDVPGHRVHKVNVESEPCENTLLCVSPQDVSR